MGVRGLVVSPPDLGAGGGAAVVVAQFAPASAAPSTALVSSLSSVASIDWRALFGASATRQALATWPAARVSSFIRSPAKNAAVGGRPNSFHLVGLASDFVLPAAQRSAFVAWARSAWPNADVVDEGDHIHVEWNDVADAPLWWTLLLVAALLVLALLVTR